MTSTEFTASAWIEALAQGEPRTLALFDGIPSSQWTVRPAPDKWALLEILGHLVDEEREDFRARLLSTLADPETPWAPIDPEGWVESRHYADRDPAELLEEFARERRDSLRRLNALEGADWSLARDHPQLGRLRAGDLLCAWVAHDHLHGQQILRTRWRGLEAAIGPFDARYAMP